MMLLRLFLTLVISYLGVWAQTQFPFVEQWILIYFTVFLISWFGGMLLGMVSTVVSLILAGLLLIPKEEFRLHHFLVLLVLTGLGFWISFSMAQYKKTRLRLSSKEDLEKARGFLDTLLENIPMMVFVKEATELRFIKFNKAGLDLLGHQKEELIGKNDFDMFPEEQAKHFVDKDREVFQTGFALDIPYEKIQTIKGERILHTKKIPITDEKGKPLYLLGVSEDITDKIEAEKQQIQAMALDAAKMERSKILERETFVANAISSLSSTLDYQETLKRLMEIVVPSVGDWCSVTTFNDQGLFERTASSHIQKSLQPLLDEFNKNYPPKEKDIEIQKTLKFGESVLFKQIPDSLIKARSQDQRQYELILQLGCYSSMVVPLKSRDKILGAVTLVWGPSRESFDELDLALCEEIGRRAGGVLENSLLFKATQKAVRARDEFLSIASHELKTPMTSLKMQIQMLQRSNDNSNIQKALGNAGKQIDRLTLLVNDLLDVSKFESGKMSYNFQAFKFNSLVVEVLDHFKDQTISMNLLKDDLEIFGDSYRLEQVLVNLINNAIKYGEGKPIQVETSKDDSCVIFIVRDHGKGISPEYFTKIFDKFERGQQDSNISGLGLGLFISKEIVLAHDGRIDVMSDYEKGSEFRVLLPLIKKDHA